MADDQFLEVNLKPGQRMRSRAADGSRLKLNYNSARTFIDATAPGVWVPPPVVTPPPITPPPVPGPTPTRTVPVGSYGDFTIGTDEIWQFEAGAVVKGKVLFVGTNFIVSGIHTTSEQQHETALVLAKGCSGIIQDGLVENIGTPSNGAGYGTLQGHDANAPAGGYFGPLTIRRMTFDQKTNGWYGVEVWGVKNLVIEDCIFKGKGGRAFPSDPTRHAENGHMSLPRSHGAIIQRNTFDMTQGCWRVVELVEMNDWKFIDNTVLGNGPTFGDCCPMAGGSSNQMARGTIQRNRVRDMQLFAYLAGSGHVVTDNRLTNVSIPYQGPISAAAQWARNDANSGPAW